MSQETENNENERREFSILIVGLILTVIILILSISLLRYVMLDEKIRDINIIVISAVCGAIIGAFITDLIMKFFGSHPHKHMKKIKLDLDSINESILQIYNSKFYRKDVILSNPNKLSPFLNTDIYVYHGTTVGRKNIWQASKIFFAGSKDNCNQLIADDIVITDTAGKGRKMGYKITGGLRDKTLILEKKAIDLTENTSIYIFDDISKTRGNSEIYSGVYFHTNWDNQISISPCLLSFKNQIEDAEFLEKNNFQILDENIQRELDIKWGNTINLTSLFFPRIFENCEITKDNGRVIMNQYNDQNKNVILNIS